MTPEEHDLLSRMDEKLAYIQSKVSTFCTFKDAASLDLGILNNANLPDRVSTLEKWAMYRDGALALLLVLVTAGRVYDFMMPH